MSDCCKVLSAQEKWLEAGFVPSEGRERVLRINERIRKCPPKMDISRARLFTEAFKASEGENLSLRWAEALLHIANNMPVYIGEDELLVGKIAGNGGRNIIMYPEIDGPYLLDVETAYKRNVSPYEIAPEDLEIVKTEIYPYWKDKSYAQTFAHALPEKTRSIIFGEDKENFSKQQYIISQTTTGRSSLNYSFDVETVLARGIGDFIREAEERLEAASASPEEYVAQGAFWEASIMSWQALSIFIKRYAEEAERLASLETNDKRQAELLQIADNCEWIAVNPARDFRSALQLQWFVLLFARLEQDVGGALGTGRMDQQLLPYYEQDIAQGKITDEEVKELFECYWLALSQIVIAKVAESFAALYEAYAHFETVVIGGQTKDGRDATNALSYLILESKRGFPTPYPDLAARIHSRTPEKFLRACIEVIKEGQGFPKLFNDEEIIPLYMAKGATRAEALNYTIAGCTESRIMNRDTYINGCATINLGAFVELVMNNGRLRALDNKQIGLATGNVTTFATFDEFMAAFKKQYDYIMYHVYVQQMVADQVKPAKLAAPYSSSLVGACRDAACDINGYVPNSIREIYVGAVGYATLIDSISNIKKLVYEDKTVSMSELQAALEADFVGYEPLQQILLNAPKYGNNNAYADSVGRDVDKILLDYLAAHHGLHGEKFSNSVVPITMHIPSGMVVGATPDGRNAGHYLSEGTSAAHGAEQCGPTAVLLSNKAVKNESYAVRTSRLLNIKLSPAAIAGEEGTQKLCALIRTWCDLKLWHVQFNVINKETLLKAKAHPEQYRDLIVRVAGYSAYFNDLSPILKDELIERAELAM